MRMPLLKYYVWIAFLVIEGIHSPNVCTTWLLANNEDWCSFKKGPCSAFFFLNACPPLKIVFCTWSMILFSVLCQHRRLHRRNEGSVGTFVRLNSLLNCALKLTTGRIMTSGQHSCKINATDFKSVLIELELRENRASSTEMQRCSGGVPMSHHCNYCSSGHPDLFGEVLTESYVLRYAAF